MEASVQQQQVGDGGILFTVAPASIKNRKLDIIYTVIFAVVALVLIPGFGVIVAALGGWLIYTQAWRLTAQKQTSYPGGTFTASPDGLIFYTTSPDGMIASDGRKVPRGDIERVVVQNYESGPRQPVSHTLYADTRGEGSEVLAGGMDLATAERLCAQVTQILGVVTDAPARDMQPGDLWLTEATPGKYELRRNIEAGHEVAASLPAPDDMVQAIAFAKQFAGDTPLWFSKLADSGPPVRVPRD